jgi:hypothetical protein
LAGFWLLGRYHCSASIRPTFWHFLLTDI